MIDYTKLGIVTNPFPEPGSDEAIEKVSVVDPEQAMKEINEALKRFCKEIRSSELQWLDTTIVDKLKRAEKCPNVWIDGAKGVGKSISLKYLLFSLQGTNLLPIYVKYPERGLPQVLEMFVRWLRHDSLKKIATKALLQYFERQGIGKIKGMLSEVRLSKAEREMIKPSELDSVINSIAEDPGKMEELLAKPVYGKIVRALENNFAMWLEMEKGVQRKLAYVISHIFELSKEECYTSMVKIRARGDIAAAVGSITKLCQEYLGISTSLLILDEFEILWRGWSKDQRFKFGTWLRGIFEAAGMDAIRVVFARVPDLIPREEIEKIPHLVDVLPFTPTNVLIFPTLDIEKTKKLISWYLGPARIPGTAGFLEPFDDSVIEKIWLVKAGLPRRILYECNSLIEYAATKEYARVDMKVYDEATKKAGAP